MRNDIGQYSFQKAFTLMEVLSTVVILMVMATLAFPKLMVTIEQGRAAEAKNILINLLGAQKRYALTNDGTYTLDIDNLDIEIRPLNDFNAPTLTDPLGVTAIASITRKAGAPYTYTLGILADGTISCGNAVGTICQNLGF